MQVLHSGLGAVPTNADKQKRGPVDPKLTFVC